MFKKGDIVESVQTLFAITLGIKYEVTKDQDGDFVTILDDSGNILGYASSNFKLVRRKYPNPPHKYCDLIIEWAKGADVLIYSSEKVGWLKTKIPKWHQDYAYKIAPTKKLSKSERIKELEDRVQELESKLAQD